MAGPALHGFPYRDPRLRQMAEGGDDGGGLASVKKEEEKMERKRDEGGGVTECEGEGECVQEEGERKTRPLWSKLVTSNLSGRQVSII